MEDTFLSNYENIDYEFSNYFRVFCYLNEGPIIGIDLGTTYSCVAIYKNGKAEIIVNDQGNRITPSVVSFSEDGERLIGESAKNQATINPTNTIYDAKRLIGRKFSDEDVQKDSTLLPYKIVDKNGKPYIQVDIAGEKKVFSPEEISAMVLQKMKSIAETYLGQKVSRAVITVGFGNQQIGPYINDYKIYDNKINIII